MRWQMSNRHNASVPKKILAEFCVIRSIRERDSRFDSLTTSPAQPRLVVDSQERIADIQLQLT